MIQTAEWYCIHDRSSCKEVVMDKTKCEAFLSVVDTGSFTKAGLRLGYTQSGITREIKSLEKDLGFQLFVRSRKGVFLTPDGEAMVPLVRDIVNAFQKAEQEGADIRGTLKGTLTIGSYFSISAMWMPQILSRFRTQYPGVRILLQEGGNAEMGRLLKERSVDCCFGARPADKDLDWIPLYEDELVVWLPKNHPMAGAPAYPVRLLESENFISTDPDDDTDQNRLVERCHLHLHTTLTTRDGFATWNMVAAGLGVSLNQRLISRDWQGSVSQVPFDPVQKIELGISLPSLHEASPATLRLIEVARQAIR